MKIFTFLFLTLIFFGCSDEQKQEQAITPVSITNDTGFIFILIDPIVPNFTHVAGYKQGDKFFMPECQDLSSGRQTVNVEVTNITHGWYSSKKAKYYISSCK